MISAAHLLAIVAATAALQGEGGVSVLVQATPRTCYVGQAVELVVGVASDRERPHVVLPRIDAEVTPRGVALQPLSTGAIGDTVFGRNLYRFRYQLIARRPGPLAIPSVTATVGDRDGASRPLTLSVRPLPAAGRPPSFLGGVGAFEVDASVEPQAVRMGQSFVYEITVSGPGARGLTATPGVERFDSLPLGIKADRLPDRVAPDDDPPRHTFVYRLRPTRAGEGVLPPLPIASFDPKTERYVTHVAPGVAVRAVDVPRFRPEDLEYGSAPEPSPAAAGRTVWMLGAAIGAAAVSGVLAYFVVVRGRRLRRESLGQAVADALARLEAADDEAEQAHVLTEGLTQFLARAVRRPGGALTPEEAEAGVAEATGSAELGERASRLISRCDRVLYDARSRDFGATFRRPETTWSWKTPLREHGEQFLRDLAVACRTRRMTERQSTTHI